MEGNPKRMARDAPTQAPEDTPSISGATSGFLKTLWYAAPDSASAAPIIIAESTRGRRIIKIALAA